MKVQIAFAAETILYFPVHCALQRLKKKTGYEIESHSFSGDEHAYDSLRRPLDPYELCICDPMRVAADARSLEEMRASKKRTTGVVIATLVSKTGLWAVRTQHYKRQDHPAPIRLTELQHPGATLGTVLTYDDTSTGGAAVQLMKKKNITVDRILRVEPPLEHEVHYLLNGTLPRTSRRDPPPSLIITCDYLGILACQELVDSTWSPKIEIDFPNEPWFSGQVFTALVANRDFVESEEGLQFCSILVKEIDRVLGGLRNNADRRRLVREAMEVPGIINLLGTPFNIDQSKVVDLSVRALQELTEEGVIPRRLHISKRGWKRALKIWRIPKRKGIRDRCYYHRCVEHKVLKKATPRQWDKFVGGVRSLLQSPVVRGIGITAGLSQILRLYFAVTDPAALQNVSNGVIITFIVVVFVLSTALMHTIERA
jgi:hypothetical protein